MDKEKLERLLKNILIFFVVFLTINYLMRSCQNEEINTPTDGQFSITTTETEFSRNKIITLDLQNNTAQTITLPNECPGEPFNVYRYENGDWIQKNSSPELNCEKTGDLTILPGESLRIAYDNWNYSLFNEMGRYKIDLTTTLNEEEKTLSTNEFTVKKEGIFSQLWDGIFYRPIYNALIFITRTIPGHDLGLAIIILTILIRTLLLAPSHKALKSQKKLQEIQPRLEKIKEKYKGDQQRIATETMAIWKEAKVNPFGSCLPMLLQIPFLIAVFYVVQRGLNPDMTHLLYVQYADFHLSDINVDFFGILNLTENNLYVLPLLIGLLQFVQMKLTTSRSVKNGPKNELAMASNMMVYVMPVMIAVFTASLPAGVGIYWGTSTIYGIIQQLFVNRSKSSSDNEPKVRVISS